MNKTLLNIAERLAVSAIREYVGGGNWPSIYDIRNHKECRKAVKSVYNTLSDIVNKTNKENVERRNIIPIGRGNWKR
jgi:hypothetical protein